MLKKTAGVWLLFSWVFSFLSYSDLFLALQNLMAKLTLTSMEAEESPQCFIGSKRNLYLDSPISNTVHHKVV